MPKSLTSLGLVPSAATSDEILLAQIERAAEVRISVLSDLGKRCFLEEYSNLQTAIASTSAQSIPALKAKLEHALLIMGADAPGWKTTIWEIPITAVQDALRMLAAGGAL